MTGTFDIIVVGLGGMGSAAAYQLASVVGEILADLATRGATRHAIDLFSARRFAR